MRNERQRHGEDEARIAQVARLFAKRLGLDTTRVGQQLRSFVKSDASQQLLFGMRGHDLMARGAAALQRATALLERRAVT